MVPHRPVFAQVKGAQSVIRTLKERVGISNLCVWQYPFGFKPGQTRALMVAEHARSNVSQATPVPSSNAGDTRPTSRVSEHGGGGSTNGATSRFSVSRLLYSTGQSTIVLEELARREADRIIKLRRKGLQCAEEIRTYGLPPSITNQLAAIRPSAQKPSAQQNDVPNIEDLLGPESFGPGIEEMQMPYPEYFPTEVRYIIQLILQRLAYTLSDETTSPKHCNEVCRPSAMPKRRSYSGKFSP